MTAKHTPDWRRAKAGIVGADGQAIEFRGLTSRCAGRPEQIAEAEANTTLAAAATQMLEALESIANRIGNRKSRDFVACQDIARNAIAAAKGEN